MLKRKSNLLNRQRLQGSPLQLAVVMAVLLSGSAMAQVVPGDGGKTAAPSAGKVADPAKRRAPATVVVPPAGDVIEPALMTQSKQSAENPSGGESAEASAAPQAKSSAQASAQSMRCNPGQAPDRGGVCR